MMGYIIGTAAFLLATGAGYPFGDVKYCSVSQVADRFDSKLQCMSLGEFYLDIKGKPLTPISVMVPEAGLFYFK